MSFGKELLGTASPLLADLISSSIKNSNEIDLFIPAPARDIFRWSR